MYKLGKLFHLFMCGIVGYIGKSEAQPILIEGLRRLEYRGYDSAGLVVLDKKKRARVFKTKGRITDLVKKINGREIKGNYGISQTRWATHGEPSEKNAHPLWDCHKKIFLVHNGIIENASHLRKILQKKGHKFRSETDTEILAHLIEDNFKEDLEEAVRLSLKKIRGTYAVAVVSEKDPDKIVFARNSSPLIMGLGKEGNFIASDTSAILKHTKKVIYLDDGEIGTITKDDLKISNLDNDRIKKESHLIDWNIAQAEKSGFPHFMLKEIHDIPEVIRNTLRGRIILETGQAKLGGLEIVQSRIENINRLIIVGMGTALLAGQIGEYMLEEYVGIPVKTENASEFRYRKPVIDKKTAVIGISQSGETIDTLLALREAKEKGALTLGVINVVGSTIAREVDAGIYNHAGPEIGVASTKAFVSQLVTMALLTVFLGRRREMSLVTGKRIIEELLKLSDFSKEIIRQSSKIKKMAERYSKFNDFFYLARKYNQAIALEGALKLKEVSYIHAEGYSAGEMKHGPIALIDKSFPSFFIIPKDSVYKKTLSAAEEIKTRGGPILAIATKGDNEIKKLTKDVIFIPKTLEMLTPILSVIPLQLFAYHMAVILGRDVDKPRNLAKSVTVE